MYYNRRLKCMCWTTKEMETIHLNYILKQQYVQRQLSSSSQEFEYSLKGITIVGFDGDSQ